MKDKLPTEEEGSLAREHRLIDDARRKADEARLAAEGADVTATSPRASPGRDADSGSAQIPTDSFVGYQIVKEIHRGGQGVVYQAVHKSTKRKVAIKVMREGPFAGPSDKARFEREVQVLGQLKHPHIVAVHDTGVAAGTHYFVMDYISGHPLDVYIASRQPSMEETLRLFATICEAVNAAHLKGVIHRDLKPGNIRIDAEGQPHILDFGLAKLALPLSGGGESDAGIPMTITGQFVGSLPWASPEQAEGNPSKIDIRTDVYSLGVILYQMLTGRFPYDVVGNMRDVLDRILKAEPAPLVGAVSDRDRGHRINDEITTIVLKCLAKKRERRYQSAGELARDIGHYLAGEPIEAKRDSAGYVLRKILHRHRNLLIGAGALLLVLLGATVVSTLLWRRAAAAESRARTEAQIAEEINRFLNEDFLAAADRGEQGGRSDVTVREVLAAAAARLDQGWLRDQPLVEAAVRTTLGKTYGALGAYEDAHRHLESALRLREAHSALDLDIARSWIDLANSFFHRGDHARAERLAEQAIRVFRSKSQDADVQLARALSLLADLKWNSGDSIGTEALAREALDVCMRSRPSALRDRTEVETLDTLVGGLSGTWSIDESPSTEKLAEAETIARRTLQRAREVFGEEHPRVADCMHSLGWVLQKERHFEEAEQLHRAGYSMRERLLGANHPRLGASMWHVAHCYLAQGRLSEAEAQLRELLAYNLRASPTPWYPAMGRVELGAVLRDEGRFSESAGLLEQGWHELVEHTGIPVARRRWALAQLVSLYEAWDAAEPGRGYDRKAAEWREKLQAVFPTTQLGPEPEPR